MSRDPSVVRDPWGVPHLTAGGVLELARLQGRTTALDRAWQLEHARWRMEGRTAEHIGAGGLAWDRFARQLRLEQTVRNCYDRLDDETRGWVGAYVAGVNEGMPLGLAAAPEIDALGLGRLRDAPRPWEPWTPLGIFWSIHVVFGTFPLKLFKAGVAQRLGRQWVDLFEIEGGSESGSNAWVIGGHRTVSGKPLLAGDPHRTIEMPNCYQQIRLTCDEFDVVGFAFPGVPGVQHFAHTGTVAWGITNAMGDYQDLTTEQLRRVDGGRIEARGLTGWEPVTLTTERVKVRDARDVEVPVAVTARGPVVSGLEGALARAAEPDGSRPAGVQPAAYSLRTPVQAEGDLGFGAFLPLLRARTVDDVEAAFQGWVEPVNSLLAADTSGRMRHAVVGRVPRRDPENLLLPVPAWDPRHEWEPGWIIGPSMEVTEVMASANDRASGGGLGGPYYADPFRAERIRDLLGERVGLDADACVQIHMDTLNGQVRVARTLLEAVAPDRLSEAARAVRSALLEWDGHSDQDSHPAALFAAWRHELVRWVAGHPMLAALHEPTGHSAVFAAWLDVTTQVGSCWQTLALRSDAVGLDIRSGVAEALEQLARQGDSSTAWGDHHRFDPIHALDGTAGAPTVDPVSIGGDSGCVLSTRGIPGITDRCSKGPVARYVWDLSDRALSRWIVPGGASGVGGSRHADDQVMAWASGELVPVEWDGSRGVETDPRARE